MRTIRIGLKKSGWNDKRRPARVFKSIAWVEDHSRTFPNRNHDLNQTNRRFVSKNLSAFTLIELVVSAALMSMILTSAYLCLHSAVVSQKLIESRDDVLQNARVAMARITADLRSACTLTTNYEFLGMSRLLGEVQADNLDFATRNFSPRQTNEADWCEVSYFLQPDRQSGKFSLWRRRDATPDDDPLSGGSREEIARGLRGLKFEYYDGFDWFADWGDPEGRRKTRDPLTDPTNISGLPEAVRVTMWFDSGSASKAKPPEEPSKEKSETEPPMVFQTVARLNLASALQSTAASSPSNNAGGNPGNQPAQGAPLVGQP